MQVHGWSLKQSEAKFEKGIFTIPLLANQTDAHLILKVYQLQIGPWRIRVEPTRQEDLEIRYDASKDTRVLDQEVLNSVVETSHVVSKNLITLYGLNRDTVIIDCDKFKIDVRDEHRLLMEFNRNENFLFDHNRSEYVPPDGGGLIPFGFTSVGIDVTWPERNVYFSGMVGHRASMNLGTTPNEPYRSFTEGGYGGCGTIQIMYAHSPNLNCALFYMNPSETFLDFLAPDDSGRRVRYISEGSFLDMFVFTTDFKRTVRAFMLLTGKPHLAPLWGFGYHQSKYSYMSEEEALGVARNLSKHHIPWDTITLDLDHLRGRGPFEFNHQTFTDPERIFDELGEANRYIIRANDCHLPLWDDHVQYQEAKKLGYYLRLGKNQSIDFVGICWPGPTSLPDFLIPEVSKWWSSLYQYGHGRDQSKPNVFFWNDMNEPSLQPYRDNRLQKDTRHINGLELRQTHSLYGLSQAAATYTGSIQRNDPPNLRAFVLTRSYFAGIQKYSWSWMGDNYPSFHDLRESIAMMTLSGMSGPYWTGCDLGGHMANTTAEILVRFFQLGAWTYSFFREHNNIESVRREPFLYQGDTYKQLVKAINDRYSMIAVWYGCGIAARWNGRGAVLPLWFEWPEVPEFHENEIVCLLADSMLVAPVTEHQQKTVNVPKPPGVWYDFWSGREFEREENVSVTMFDIPVYIRGGRIIPWYAHPVNTTIATVVTPLTLYVAENESGSAEGSYYMDDGITFNASVNNIFVHRRIRYADGELSWTKATYPVEESGVPNFLKAAIVESIVFYRRSGVSRVTGLSLPVCDVWVWRKGDGIVYHQEDRDNSFSRAGA